MSQPSHQFGSLNPPSESMVANLMLKAVENEIAQLENALLNTSLEREAYHETFGARQRLVAVRDTMDGIYKRYYRA